MAKLTQCVVTALKEGACVSGLVLKKDAIVTVDLSPAQVSAVQASVDAGDVSCEGMSTAPAPSDKPKK